jgi:transglutaminase-like putative cysteine protease
MDRRTFIRTGIALGAFPQLSRAAFAADEPRAWRVFEVTTTVQVLRPAGLTQVWLPVPLMQDTDYQKDLGSRWSASGATVRLVTDAKYRAGIVHAQWPPSVTSPVLALVSRFATRERTLELSRPAAAAAEEDPAVLRLNLEPTELIPTDGIVRETALEVTRGARTEIEKARAIYEWVVDNTFRDPKVRGCGWGDIKTMLETRNFGGKCGDLNALFVGLARAVGVPARDIYGLRVAPSARGYRSLGANSADVTRAQHCRAEFYARGYGWVPVDPADVRKVVLEEPPGNLALTDERVVRARRMLFGAWEMNWLAYNYAHDVRLPGSRGGAIPYFMYPHGETAREALDPLEPDTFRYAISARELTVA